jgi:hypothetical protein
MGDGANRQGCKGKKIKLISKGFLFVLREVRGDSLQS